MKNEHRQLEQHYRCTPDSIDTQPSVTSNPHFLSRSFPTQKSGSSEPSSNTSTLGRHTLTHTLHHPNTITIQAEVHEDYIPTSQWHNAASTTADGIDKCTTTTPSEGKSNDLLASSKPTEQPLISGLVIANSDTVDMEQKEREGSRQKHSNKLLDLHQKNDSISDRRTVSDASVSLNKVFSSEYRAMLEDNFITNHLYGKIPQSISEATNSITLQAQVYNYIRLVCIQLHSSSVQYVFTQF